MKKVMISLVSVILMVGIAVIGCAESAPAPTPTTPTTTPTPTPAPAVKPIELKLTHHTNPMSCENVAFEQWIKEVDKRTQGRVKITNYPAETLGKAADEWVMLTEGVCDISFIMPMWIPGKFPLSDAFDLPFLIPSGRPLSVVNGVFDKFVSKEWSEAKSLWPHPLGDVQLHTKKPIRTMEDLKGFQMRSAPGPQSDGMKALGATPVSMPAPEVYTSLERGVVDGTTMPIEAAIAFKFYEPCDFHTMANYAVGMASIVMNLNTWNSLPPDIQEIISELNPWAQQLMVDEADAADEAGMVIIEEAGNEIIYLSPEEKARWVQATKPVLDDWAAKMDARGLPGTDLVNEVNRLAAAAGK